MANLFNPIIDGVQHVTYHRNPTEAEIKSGYGATHYRDFPAFQVLKGFRLKRWTVGPDGLRYYR